MTSRFDVALSFVRAAVALSIDALAPPACAACDDRLATKAVLCAACAATVELPRPSGVAAAAVFGGAIETAIKKLKYGNRPDLARPLAELLRKKLREMEIEADVVVPVPLHPRRLAERGFNQAALLAAPLARDGLRFLPRALRRVRHTPQQARLSREERLVNVEGAFVLHDELAVRGRRVVLVDDVVTTGSTLLACRRVLAAAGAEVHPLVVARAED